MSDGRVVIVTVHGTGDTALSAEGEKWFQKGSAFAERLIADLDRRGVHADLLPHLWSGANSARARENGANALASRLNTLRRQYDAVHLIGHSHGGNVANDAAVAAGWRGDACKSRIKSITTVGTPFFRRDIGVLEWIASFMFLSFVRLAMVLLVFGLAFCIAMPFLEATPPPITFYEGIAREEPGFADASPADLRARAEEIRAEDRVREGNSKLGGALTGGVVLALALAGLFFVHRMARNGWLRVSRIRRRARRQASVHAIWHPNDEAIAFLRRVEALPLTAFPKGALWRGSHQTAINLAVQAMLLLALALIVMWLAGAYGVTNILGWVPPDIGLMGEARNGVTGEVIVSEPNPVGNFGATALLYLLLSSPLLFFFIYGVVRFIAGAIPELFMRGWYNGVVLNALRSAAFGRDGDERIGRVSTRSHYFDTREIALAEDVAMRMQTASHSAADALLQKYRWSLFSVADQADNNAMQNLSADAMTWDSLIHTTYFDQPELADIIAEHIAATETPALA